MNNLSGHTQRARVPLRGKKVIILVGAFVLILGIVLVSAYVTSTSQKGLVGHWALDSEGYNSATGRVTDKTPNENHGTCTSDGELVTNGDAETGDVTNWNLDGVDDADFYAGAYSFYEIGGTKTVISTEYIPINLDKAYYLEGWFKSVGVGGLSKLYFGYVPYDEDKVRIANQHVNVVVGTETTLYANVDSSDTIVQIVDGTNWYDTITHEFMAFDIDDSGNYNDLPNRILSSQNIISLTDQGAYWDVEFNTAVGKTYSAGTKVRMHTSGAGYMYTAAANNNIPTDWTNYADSGGITGENLYGAGYGTSWWPGTKYARILMLTNYGQDATYEFNVDDISLTTTPATCNGVALTTDQMGQSEGAMNFDTTGYIGFSNALVEGLTELSISAWVNPKGLTYMFQHGSSYSHNGYLLYFRVNADGSLSTDVEHAATGHFATSSDAGEVPMDTWSHVSMIVDSDSVDFYVNGVMVDTNPFSGMYALAASSTVYRNIGRYYYNADSIYYSAGNLSDVQVHNYALSATEIQSLYDSYRPKASAGGLQKGLMGHWVLDGEGYNSNTERITDKTPYENHGVNSAATLTTDQNGQSNRAMNFDGNGDNVEANGYTYVFTTELTLASWFKYSGAGVGSPRILELSALGDATSHALAPDPDGSLRGWVECSTGRVGAVDDATQYDDGEWHHMVYTYSSPDAVLYVDGVQTDTGSGACANLDDTPYNIIGAISDGSGAYAHSSNEFDGDLSDARVYDRALSADEISTLYDSYRPKASAGSLQKGLVLDMPLKSKYMKSSTVLTDRTPYSNDGTNNGAEVGEDFSTFIAANTDYVLIGGTGDLDVQDLTISQWNYADNYDANMFMFEKTTNGVVNTQYSLFFDTAGSNFRILFRTYSLSTTDLRIADHADGPVDGQWNHIVATYDSASDVKKIYNNGVEIASASSITGTINTNPAGTSWIGTYGGGAGYPFQGNIANTRVYNRALSAEEIKLLYDKGR